MSAEGRAAGEIPWRVSFTWGLGSFGTIAYLNVVTALVLVYLTTVMKIDPGTQSGKILRLRGQGLPVLEGRGRGDQHVRLFVEVPKKLSDRQKELLKEFAELDRKSSGNTSFFDKIVGYFS